MALQSPLKGIRVVDFTHVMAGPFCTHTLSLLGAEVIKIERIGEGDVMRHYDVREEYKELAPPFCAVNAGKQSIALDLKSDQAKEIVWQLIKKADVVVENFRPEVLARLGFSYKACKEVNDKLIYCSISGFGQQGPLKDNPAYDHIVQAMSGVMSLSGEPGSKHTKVGFPVLDTFAGYTAAMAIMTALFQRERQRERQREGQGEKQGKGEYIDVAMLDASLNLMISMVAPFLIAGDIPKKVGNRGFNQSPTSDTFKALDSDLSIGANTQKQYESMCQVLELANLISDPRFADRESRIKNDQQLRIEIENRTQQKSAVDWEVLLNKAGVPSAAIRTVAEIIEHEHIETRALKVPINLPGQNTPAFTLGPGFAVELENKESLPSPPRLGEQSINILKSLDYDDEIIQQLISDNIIQTAV